MYTMTQLLPLRRLLQEQLPAIILALMVAELFYKFHSFLLEAGAFLLTWFAFDALIQLAAAAARHARAGRSSG